jgi:hypothetical protein
MKGREPQQDDTDSHKEFLDDLTNNLTEELKGTQVETSLKELVCCLQFSYIMGSESL